MHADMKLLNWKLKVKLTLTIIEHHTVMLHGREKIKLHTFLQPHHGSGSWSFASHH
jgi:hypothetical protein